MAKIHFFKKYYILTVQLSTVDLCEIKNCKFSETKNIWLKWGPMSNNISNPIWHNLKFKKKIKAIHELLLPSDKKKCEHSNWI